MIPGAWGEKRREEREERGAKRSARVQIAETFGAQKRAHAQWEGGGYGMYAAAPTKPVLERTEQDGPRENVVSDGGWEGRRDGGTDGWVDGWMDGRAENAHEFVCSFSTRRGSRLVSIRRPVVIRVLTLVAPLVELFGIKFGNLSTRDIFPRDVCNFGDAWGSMSIKPREFRVKFT